MAVNFAVKYAKAIAKRFTHASFVKPNTNNHLDFTGNKTVRIYQLTTVDETAYKLPTSAIRHRPPLSFF